MSSRLGDAVIVRPDGTMVPRPFLGKDGKLHPIPLHPRHRAVVAAVNEGLARGTSLWWPLLELVPKEARQMVLDWIREWRPRWVEQRVWEAAAPRFTVDGRRFA